MMAKMATPITMRIRLALKSLLDKFTDSIGFYEDLRFCGFGDFCRV